MIDNKLFPECYNTCKPVKFFGVCECESICPDKFKGVDMVEYFKIDGYFIEDGFSIEGALIKSTHDVVESEDDNIFFYGLSKEDIKWAMDNKEPVQNEFIITSYWEVTNGRNI